LCHRCGHVTTGHVTIISVTQAVTNSWLTGTAAWNFVALTQHILGINPEHDGLRIDPRVPANWPGFDVVRRFRGATYHIAVRNTRNEPGRVSTLVVDRERVNSNLVPVAPEGAAVTVEAMLDD
jgi:cellobiose phosphorylase